jgi:hypothetical protein
MRRIHLLEIGDQPWCPTVLRDGGTSWLRFVAEKTGHANVLAEALAPAIRRSGSREILDLCSGGGGPMVVVAQKLREHGLPVTVRLTDLYPNVPALLSAAAATPDAIVVERRPVDATAVPADLGGFRILCNAFHHFRPAVARRILEDAVEARSPIAVLEVVEREPWMVASLPLLPLSVAVALPFLRPFHWAWLALFLLGLLPAFVLWDGLVSTLRIYGPRELAELTAGLDSFEWELRRIRLGRTPAHATVLIGLPR